MKKLLLVTTILSGIAYGQEVPEEIENCLNEKFPTIESARWEENKGVFVATFFDDDIYYEVKISEEECIIETRSNLEYEELNSKIVQYLDLNSEDFSIDDIFKIEKVNGNTSFHVLMSNESEELFLEFNENGTLKNSKRQQY